MSDTAFIHEVRPGTPLTRVQLVMDYEEVASLANVAAAAVDLSVIASDMVDDETATNAAELLRWSVRAGQAMDALTPKLDGKE